MFKKDGKDRQIMYIAERFAILYFLSVPEASSHSAFSPGTFCIAWLANPDSFKQPADHSIRYNLNS